AEAPLVTLGPGISIYQAVLPLTLKAPAGAFFTPLAAGIGKARAVDLFLKSQGAATGRKLMKRHVYHGSYFTWR
ncbi:hypothetical protein, partial [Serratia rubidaea]|uniref:hypothetical protein n=1 Tax=Serratia rubidaea TaxID=61652 RepID=UPI001F33C108